MFAGALTEPLACVVHGVLGTPSVQPGDLAVVAGPGAIGLLTLQVLKAAGATTVMVGTDTDSQRLELARALGADFTLNVANNEPSQLLRELTPDGQGADVVYECSGAGAAAQQLLNLVRRGGRYVQIGLFGKAVNWDIDQICYKELVVSGSNASTPSSWLKALRLLASGKVRTEPLISGSYPLDEWSQAFDDFENKRGTKLLLIPET
jgi:L-iditol 2-dehydrogenase